MKDGLKTLEFYQTEPYVIQDIMPNTIFGLELFGRSPFSEIMLKFDEQCFNEVKFSRLHFGRFLSVVLNIESSKSFADQSSQCEQKCNDETCKKGR